MGLSFLELVELFSGVVESQPPTMLVLEPFGKRGQVHPPFVSGLGCLVGAVKFCAIGGCCAGLEMLGNTML